MEIAGALSMGSLLAASGAYALQRRRPWIGDLFAMAGVTAATVLLVWLWIGLGRPPMRTLGETRWWYACLVPLVGLVVGWRFGTRALAVPACLMGALFAFINLRHPEYMDRTLMPALQSPWFVPHVIVYMLAYSALGIASLCGAWTLLSRWRCREPVTPLDADLPHRLVLIGLPLLTCGLLFGALWAKEAWGHYWTWDPKETWAFLTWAAYTLYLHVRARHPLNPRLNLALLALGFAVLLGCWFGVNYLPTARESVHTYAG